MIRRTCALLVLGGLVTSACGGSDETSASTTEFTLPALTTTTTAPAATTSPVAATSTTTASTTSTTATTTTSPPTTVAPSTTVADPATVELLLSGDGIGTAGFGTEPEGTIQYIDSYLGAPSDDTGWIDPLTIGLCPGDEIRRVSWGVLTLLFGDVSDSVQGRRHFFGYSYGDQGEIGSEPIGLQTTRGVTIGSRVIDVRAAYPAVTITPEDDFTAPFFFVNDSLRGFLTGVDDDATVTAIFGGDDCGVI